MADDPQILIVSRGRGRPRQSPEEQVSLSTWVPVSVAEQVYKMAEAERISVSALVKQLVTLRMRR